MTQTVIGIFDSVDDAQRAINHLESEGISRDRIDLSSRSSDYSSGTTTASTTASHEEEGFGESISRFFSNLFSDDEDQARKYSTVAQRGTIVTVHTSSADESERVANILDRFGSVDVDERSRAYSTGDYASTTDTTSRLSDDADRTISVVQEELQVGKREIETGGIRVRSRIIETPVEETLRLRSEKVWVNRNAVNRPATDADFKEETIEITQHAEVPVVAKEARVVEEVKVGKAVEQNEQTIRETVRHTDVDVDEQSRSSDLATMTSAANCDKGCELQKLVSHHFLERNWHRGDEPRYE